MRFRAILATVTAVLAMPAGATAAVDFGSNLNATTSGGFVCPDGCSNWNRSIAPADTLSATAAPIGGVIVRYTIKHGSVGGGYHWPPVHLRVVHQIGPVTWQGLESSSPDVTPPAPDGVDSYPARTPIAAGDLIGLDAAADPLGAIFAYAGVGGTTRSITQPALPADGSSVTATDTLGEILLQARIEPDSDHDGFGDETQDACPSAAGSNGGCPVTAKHKCKKRHHRTAAAAKKKCRKHKHH
jgi:hypothetical protein